MAERLAQQAFISAKSKVVDNRLDALRGRADWLAGRINRGMQHESGRDEREYYALMWAIAELSGIGDEVRAMNAARDDNKVTKNGKLLRRVEHFERLYEDARLKIVELKARNQFLSDELNRRNKPQASDAVDPQASDHDKPTTRDKNDNDVPRTAATGERMSCRWCLDDDGQCDCEERLKCPQAGKVGHQCCGWCPEHASPRSVCHCMAEIIQGLATETPA